MLLVIMVKIQKDCRDYFDGYDDDSRLRSYENQIAEVSSLGCQRILEIGIGNAYVSKKMKGKGFDVVSFDFDFSLGPSVVGDMRFLPFKDSSFDVVLCAEVLEHVRFCVSVAALREIYRVSGKSVVLTLPQSRYPYWYKLLFLRKTLFGKPIGEHYWEIGWVGFSLEKVILAFEDVGFKVLKNYVFSGNKGHRFFVLEK